MSSLILFILIDLVSIIFACLITYYLITRTSLLDRLERRKGRNSSRFNTVTRKFIHEIRNPLNSVSLNLQLLEENFTKTKDNDVQEQNDNLSNFDKDRAAVQLGRIRREVDRLNRILKDFRRYAKLPELELQDTEIGNLIEEVLDFIEPETERQDIHLIRNIDSLPNIKLDSAQIRQMLINLIINANQAMEDGGKLTVSARLSGNYIIIEIEDTGPGIPPEVQDKMFELFYSTKKDGTGVGLAIVKQVIEKHGGKIKVKSQIDEGTKFTIFLPIKK